MYYIFHFIQFFYQKGKNNVSMKKVKKAFFKFSDRIYFKYYLNYQALTNQING